MKCWVCGKEATRTRQEYYRHGYSKIDRSYVRAEVKPSKYRRCYCDECLNKTITQEQDENNEYIRLKKRRMFLRACEILENQHTNMYAYREAIDAVEEHITENPDKYDSAYEVLTAIILIHNRIHVKMQHKVGRYQVDFILPDMLVALEIDGDRHAQRKVYDSRRDRIIQAELGPHWQIIRINTDYLDQNAKALPKAINGVLDHRLSHS